MTINKDHTINYNSMVTKEDLLKEKEEKDFIAQESLYHVNYLTSTYPQEYLKTFIVKRAREIAFLWKRYETKSDTTKEVIAANIVFYDDEAFIKALLSKKISFHQLYCISRLISSIKKHESLNLSETGDIKKAKSKIKELCNFIYHYFGVRDYNLIIAKLNEILVFKMELYRKLEQEQTNKIKVR